MWNLTGVQLVKVPKIPTYPLDTWPGNSWVSWYLAYAKGPRVQDVRGRETVDSWTLASTSHMNPGQWDVGMWDVGL